MVTHALANEATLSASSNIYLDVPHCITTVGFNKMLYASFIKKKNYDLGVQFFLI